jgi:hypothetical protein
MEKEHQERRSGVPLLGDIPIVQYFFASRQKEVFNKSTLFLITPRPAQFVESEPSSAESALQPSSPQTGSVIKLKEERADLFRPSRNVDSIFEPVPAVASRRPPATGCDASGVRPALSTPTS